MPDPALYSDTIPPVTRTKDDELFLLRIETTPLPENPEAGQLEGAYAVALVNAVSLKEAEEKMLEELEIEGWEPVRFEHWEIVCRGCYRVAPEPELEDSRRAEESIDRAFSRGISLTFYTWPLGVEDDGE
jgi:hypothetical protein